MMKLLLFLPGFTESGSICQVIPYSHLMEELDISNVRELEDLLITECFYGQLMKGKLDQNQRYLHVRIFPCSACFIYNVTLQGQFTGLPSVETCRSMTLFPETLLERM